MSTWILIFTSLTLLVGAGAIYQLIDRFMPRKSFKEATIMAKHMENCSSVSLNHSYTAQSIQGHKYMLVLSVKGETTPMIECVSEGQYHAAQLGKRVKITVLHRRLTKGIRGFIKYEFKL